MKNQWESKRLHEHPVPHQKGIWGKICLSEAGIYCLRVGAANMSCPQDWAARVQAQEEDQEETSYILKGIPAELWHQVKVKAAQEQITLKEVLLVALQKFISEEERNEKPNEV
jgi:hypothetical protein